MSTNSNDNTTWNLLDKPKVVENFIPHDEPVCDGKCGRKEPHSHGLPCYTKCMACWGLCHPDCQAYDEEKMSSMRRN